MSTTSSGGTGRKAFSAKVQAKAQSGSSCSFCWFVLAIYPTLEGMTPQDALIFGEHLRKVHGLAREIAP